MVVIIAGDICHTIYQVLTAQEMDFIFPNQVTVDDLYQAVGRQRSADQNF